MKRYVSFDFLKGIAIIGVLGFHLMSVLYDANAAIASDPPVIFYLLLVFFGYVGNFFGLFIILSAIGNTISIKSRWDAIEDRSPENLKVEGNKIMKGQVIRGLLTFIIGFLSEWLLNGLLIWVITDEPEIARVFVEDMYLINIIELVGLGTIFGGILYVKYLQKSEKSENAMPLSKFLLITGAIFLVINIILIFTLPLIPGFSKYPGKGCQDRDFWTNFGFFLLFPLIGRVFPIFPNLIYTIFGIYLGEILAKGELPEGFFKKVIYASIGLLIIGIPLALINTENSFLKNVFEVPLVLDGILLMIFIFFYLVEFRGKAKPFAGKTVLIRKFGLLTLTIWCLQWIMPLVLKIIYLIESSLDPSMPAFRESKYWTGGFTGWEFWGFFFCFIALYSIIIVLWSKKNYVGSIEWMIAKAIGRSQKLDLDKSIYNVEGFYKTPNTEAKARYGYLALLLFYIMAIPYVLFYVM